MSDTELVYEDRSPEEIIKELEIQIPLIINTITQFKKSQRITHEDMMKEITI